MRRFVFSALTCALVLGLASVSQADEKNDAVLAELATQLKEMRGQIDALRQENQRLQAMVAQQNQQQPDPRAMMPGGSETPAQLFDDPGHIRIIQRPGYAPPSWLDLLIEQNRQRTLEAMMQARANERLADDRRAKIAAESKAVGTAYCPRPLRESALVGGDVKVFRDQYVASRSADFDALFNQVSVKEYLKTKAARLSGQVEGTYAIAESDWVGGQGIAPAQARILANRLRTDLEDAKILYGPAGLHGPAPAGLATADELTRKLRHSKNPQVSGPTRDMIASGRRSAAVDEAVANDMDIELVLRMNQVREARRQMLTGGYVPSAAQIHEDIAQVNDVLNGKISRTRVPEVQAFTGFDARRD